MKTKEIREFTKEEILKKLADGKLELKNLRFSKAKGEDKSPLKRRELKRNIARLLTIQKEKGWN